MRRKVDIVKVEDEKLLDGMVELAGELGAVSGGAAADPESMRANLSAMIAADAYDIFAAVDSGKVMAFVAVHYYREATGRAEYARIGELAARAELRGGDLARDLVRAAAMAARVRGCERVGVAAVHDDDSALEFYHAIGFDRWRVLLEMDLVDQRGGGRA